MRSAGVDSALVGMQASALPGGGFGISPVLGTRGGIAIETDVGGWWADPRVMLSGIVWAIFGAYIYLHYMRSASGRTVAWLALIGLVFVTALAITARIVPAGFHVFGVAG